jgi:Arc/MetJ-type ribon-helix-helix transcriptional regulator
VDYSQEVQKRQVQLLKNPEKSKALQPVNASNVPSGKENQDLYHSCGLRDDSFDSGGCCNRINYMRATLTVSLPEEINLGLTSLVKRSGKSRSQVVQEALRRQIAIERFRDLRERLAPKGRKAGFYTDEDVFDEIS